MHNYSDLNEIYSSERTNVYKAIRKKNEMSVVLKIRKKSSYETSGSLLSDEFDLASSLTGTYIPEYIRYEIQENMEIISMKDDNYNPISSNLLTGELDFDLLVNLSIMIIKAIDSLHSQGLIHKKLTPGNILINQSLSKLKIIDFEKASRISEEKVSFLSPIYLAGSLEYISPEQTGRNNRNIDYRSDYYSLGIILYQLLSGRLPFNAKNKMELIHSHLAKKPNKLDTFIKPEKKIFSKIIMKLLNKNPDERYQSAKVLIKDLEFCINKKLKGTKEQSEYAIGENDYSSRFMVPHKLYGRDKEISLLRMQFDKVCNRETIVLLVKGHSGIGKTSIIKELQKDIVLNKAYFGAGKYEHLKKNIAYSAIAQVFSDLISQILTESDERVQLWRRNVQNTLGNNGQVIIDIIPELELLIGKQPKVEKLGATETKNRFNIVFQEFITIFDEMAHPLVLFLDDLQWIDLASLDLIQLITADCNTKSFLFIGAYRDNEVDDSHPAMQTLDEIAKTGVEMVSIHLDPLKFNDINQWISDTVKSNVIQTKQLSELIKLKTNGNPFFVKAFLNSLHDDNLLQFSSDGYWEWDIEEIKATKPTDNVKDLMIHNIENQSHKTVEILSLASCIGNTFSLPILLTISGENISVIKKALYDAQIAGMIYTIDNQYKFSHDKVIEATYSLIPAEQRPEKHLKIGRLLLKEYDENENNNTIFDIVEHLNKGFSLIEDASEIHELMILNIKAGQRAKNSTAYNTARHFFCFAESLLSENSWKTMYEFTFDLYAGWAESEFMSTNYEKSEELFQLILRNTNNLIDRSKIYKMILLQYNSERFFEKAIELSIKLLNELGIDYPQLNQIDNTYVERQKIRLADNEYYGNIKKVIKLHEINNLEMKEAIGILTSVLVPYWNISPLALTYLCYEIVNLSLEHGLCSSAAIGFSMLGSILASQVEMVDLGFDLSKLAIDIAERYDDKFQLTAATYTFYNHVHFWKKPLAWHMNDLIKAYHIGIDSGNNQWASYCLNHYCMRFLLAGINLTDAINQYDKYVEPHYRLRQSDALTFFNPPRQTVENLVNITDDPCRLVGKFFNEDREIKGFFETKQYSAIGLTITCKLILLAVFQNFEKAIEIVKDKKSEAYIRNNTGQFQPYIGISLYGIALLRNINKFDKKSSKIIKQVKNICSELKLYSDINYENFGPYYHLLSAEIALFENRKLDAIDQYDLAIETAAISKFLHIEGIANELSGTFWFNRNKIDIAETYIRKSYECFERWNCKPKIIQMRKEYPFLTPMSSSNSNITFDESSVIKATQTISSEIEIDKILEKLVHIIIENAGAQRGYIILNEETGWYVAEGFDVENESKSFGQKIPLGDSNFVSENIINYVIRSGDIVLLDDAEDSRFSSDPFIVENHCKSILAMPFKQKNEISGILFLDNDLDTAVFSDERIELLNIILSQVAISIENARLFELHKKIEKDMRNLQNYLSNIINSMPSLLVGVDSTGKITQWNSRAEKITGIPVDNAIGKEIEAILPNIGEELINVKMAIEKREVCYKSRISTDQNGQDQYEDITIYPLIANGVDGAVVRIDDVTSEHILQEQLKQSQKMDAIGQLAGGIAHDFNNMLGGIMGGTEILQNKIESDDEKQEFLSIIMESAEHAADLAGKLLAFSRRQNLKSVVLDVHDVITTSVSILRNTLDKNIETIINLDAESSIIEGDPTLLQSLFMNLGINASHAMPNGGVLSISSYVKNLTQIEFNTSSYNLEEGDYLEVRVNDTGLGIDADELLHIFEPFYTTKKQGKGTGLGLAAVYGTVQQHKGAIFVQSKAGFGTTFIIFLPLSEERLTESVLQQNSAVHGKGLVLLIDDEQSMRITGKTLLNSYGYDVLLAENGLKAVEIFKDQHNIIDLVILDMIMPVMNGHECFNHIKQINENVPILLASGFTRNDDLIDLKKKGLSGFIHKPYRGVELSKSVAKALNSEE